jgi:hypothetical protein
VQSCTVIVGTPLLVILRDSWSDDRSASAWSGASSACHTPSNRDQFPRPSRRRFSRTGVCSSAAIRGPGSGRGNRPTSARLVTTSRVDGVISNWTGRCVFCCSTIARSPTRSPWHTSRTRKLRRSQARSLLSMPRSNRASSRRRPCISRRTRMDQISFSLKGAFWPTNLPLFHTW